MTGYAEDMATLHINLRGTGLCEENATYPGTHIAGICGKELPCPDHEYLVRLREKVSEAIYQFASGGNQDSLETVTEHVIYEVLEDPKVWRALAIARKVDAEPDWPHQHMGEWEAGVDCGHNDAFRELRAITG